MNQITVVGRLTRDPELKTAKSGNEFCKFTLACSRYQGKDKEEATDFFDCLCSGARGVAISKYAKKGNQLIVFGEMASNKGTKADTEKITYWSIKVNEWSFGATAKNDSAQSNDTSDVFHKIADSDIPF